MPNSQMSAHRGIGGHIGPMDEKQRPKIKEENKREAVFLLSATRPLPPN
jgi:hypothetical protein